MSATPAMPVAPPPLILWDIDHTLLSIAGFGREVYARAFAQITGRPLVHLADMAGRTEQSIITETLALNGVEVSISFADYYAALGEAARLLQDQMLELGHVLVGAREALAAFAADGAVQTLVTGNIPSIAATKLEAFGLSEFVDLEVGGYGDESGDRAVLVRSAVERAEGKYGYGFTAEHAVVIGDTPHDVRGALDNGALAVAVATGTSSAEALAAAGADLVLADLRDLTQLRDLARTRREARSTGQSA